MSDLRTRASTAFDAEFRDRLANAVQVAVLRGDSVGVSPWCRCPLGCLTKYPRPNSEYMFCVFPRFTAGQFTSFIAAFDDAAADNTPEAALGLLYRERLMKRDL